MTKDKYLFRKKSQKFNPLLLGVVVILILVLVFQQSALQPMIVEAQVPKPAPPRKPATSEFQIRVEPKQQVLSGGFPPIQGGLTPLNPTQTSDLMLAIQKIPSVQARINNAPILMTAQQVVINKLLSDAVNSEKAPDWEILTENLVKNGYSKEYAEDSVRIVKDGHNTMPGTQENALWEWFKTQSSDGTGLVQQLIAVDVALFSMGRGLQLVKLIPAGQDVGFLIPQIIKTIKTWRTGGGAVVESSMAIQLTAESELVVSIRQLQAAAAQGATATETAANLRIVAQGIENEVVAAETVKVINEAEKLAARAKWASRLQTAGNVVVLAISTWQLIEGRKAIDAATNPQVKDILEKRQLATSIEVVALATLFSPWAAPTVYTSATVGWFGTAGATTARFLGPLYFVYKIAREGYRAHLIYDEGVKWAYTAKDWSNFYAPAIVTAMLDDMYGNYDSEGRSAAYGTPPIVSIPRGIYSWISGSTAQQEDIEAMHKRITTDNINHMVIAADGLFRNNNSLINQERDDLSRAAFAHYLARQKELNKIKAEMEAARIRAEQGQ